MEDKLNERLAARGFRSTTQREHVYSVLLGERDHPTAEQIFMRAKKTMPEISMATVYNCLDTLVKAGLIREVNLDRTAMRYCPNMREHCHFYCDECGGVYDIDVPVDAGLPGINIPKGYRVNRFELAIHGACPRCARRVQQQ
jgi:Fur family peroxide stress response transcriptional regulator